MSAIYNRVVIKGSLPGGEVWTVNPAFGGAQDGGLTAFSDLQDWATAIAALNGGHVLDTVLLGLIGSSSTVDTVRTESFTANGDLTQAAEAPVETSTNGSAAVHAPLQVALVASLLTGRPGRSYSGRIYWPALSAPMNSTTARVNPADVETFATSTAALLELIAEAAPVDAALAPVVVSHKLQIQTPVTTVRVGDVLDTQRRRRDKLVEAYTGAPIGG